MRDNDGRTLDDKTLETLRVRAMEQIGNGAGVCHTELEFAETSTAGMPRLVFLLREATVGPAELFVDPRSSTGRQRSGRECLRAGA